MVIGASLADVTTLPRQPEPEQPDPASRARQLAAANITAKLGRSFESVAKRAAKYPAHSVEAQIEATQRPPEPKPLRPELQQAILAARRALAERAAAAEHDRMASIAHQIQAQPRQLVAVT